MKAMFHAKMKLTAAILVSVCLATAAGVTTYHALAEEPSGQPTARKAEPLPANAVARFGAARLHHGGTIQYLVFSPDGRLLVSVGPSHNQPRPSICVWDPSTGDLVRQFAGAEQGMGVAFAGPKVLVDLDNARSVFYDLETGGDAAGFAWCKIPGRGMDVSPDGKMLAIIPVGRDTRVAETATGKVKYGLGPGDWVRFSPDGNLVLVVSAFEAKDRTALYNAVTGEWVRNIDTGGLKLQVPCFSPDSTRFAACAPGQVMVWETATGKLLHKIMDIASDSGNVSFSSDGKRLAVAGRSGIVIILEPPKEKPVAEIQAYTQHIERVVFSPDGRFLAAGGDNGQIRIWDGQTYKELHTESGNRAEVNDATVSPCGKFILTGGVDGTARLWSAAGGQELRRLADSPTPITAVTFGSGKDGSLLAAAVGKEETVSVFEAASGKMLRSVKVPNGASAYLGFAAGRNSLLAVGPSGLLSTIDLADGKVTSAGQADKAAVAGHIAVTPDGRLAASSDGKATTVWETARGKRRAVFGAPVGGQPLVSALDRFGSLVASLVACDAGMKVVIYEIDSGRPCREMVVPLAPVDEGQYGLAFSNDGDVLAVGDIQGTISLASVRSGEQLGQRIGHRNRIISLAFSADDKRLISGSADTTAAFWKLDDIPWPRPAAARLDDAALGRLWDELANGDAGKGREAIVALAAGGDQAAAFLGKRLDPACGPAEKEIQKLIHGLGSEQFDVREQSSEELAKLGLTAEAALRKAQKESPDEEVRTKAARLLDAMEDPIQRTGELIRQLRAIRAIERIGSAKALEVLDSLARANFTQRTSEAAERVRSNREATRQRLP